MVSVEPFSNSDEFDLSFFFVRGHLFFLSEMAAHSIARTALYILMVAPQAASAFIECGVWQVISAGAGQASAPLMHLLAL